MNAFPKAKTIDLDPEADRRLGGGASLETALTRSIEPVGTAASGQNVSVPFRRGGGVREVSGYIRHHPSDARRSLGLISQPLVRDVQHRATPPRQRARSLADESHRIAGEPMRSKNRTAPRISAESLSAVDSDWHLTRLNQRCGAPQPWRPIDAAHL